MKEHNIVKIINGEYEGFIGRIDRIYTENDVTKYDVIISRDGRISYESLSKVTVNMDDTIEYDYNSENQNNKTLCKNSFVRVIDGPYKGDIGILVDVLDNNVCVVITNIKSDINREKPHIRYELSGTQKFIEKDFIECIDQNNNLLRDIRSCVNQFISLSESINTPVITAQQQPSPSFDITKYLSEEEIAEISRKAFTDKINDKVDIVLKNRAEAGLSVVDQVINETCKKYTEKLSDKFEEDFLKVAKEEIQRENIPEGRSEYDIFRYDISRCLGDAVKVYIDNNRDKIEELMKDQIEAATKNITTDSIINILKQKINIESILKESFKDNK